MVDVDKLTDAELRAKLMEFGFPSLPITGTTRKVMVKKLKLLLENQSGGKKADARHTLGRYSSEEDSDTDAKAAKTRRRATIGGQTMQPPAAAPTLKKTTRIVETTIEEDVPKPTLRGNASLSASMSTNRVSRVTRNTVDEFDTGSESESEIARNSRQDVLASPEVHHKPQRKSLDSSYSRTFSSVGERPSAFSSPLESANERINQLRSRISLAAGGDRASGYTSSPSTSYVPDLDKVETPFLSNFTKRLSQLPTARSTENSSYRSNESIKEHDTNGATVYPRSSLYSGLKSTIRPRAAQYDLNRSSRTDSQSLKNNVVPFAVLSVAILFFVVLGFAYLGMRSDTSLESAGFKVPKCEAGKPNLVRGVNCVHEDDVQKAVNLLKPLRGELTERAVGKRCSNSDLKDRMDESDVISFVERKFKFTDVHKISTDLRNLQVLILHNPSWGLSIVQAAPDEDITEKHIVHNLDKLGFERITKPLSLTVLDPPIPWTCILANKFYLLVKTLLILIAIFASVYAANFGYKRYVVYRTKEQNMVVGLVENILDILQNGDGDSGYMVINHVRDMIIPVNERKAKEKIWKQAVNFINENESRVRTEVQVVQGEEYFVWRWVGSTNLSSNASRNKSWQGQAFETQTGAVNSLPCSPTPCLKVRGMVEDGDRNTQVIKEAVLSKCASKCRILHCSVDTGMKCVYLKCADTNEAAIAYQNLHGWWYAGQLVTVKYLRLERYMQRFPDSPISGPPYLKATLPHSDGWTN